jgi:exodeoxyribonuclease VII small subunit
MTASKSGGKRAAEKREDKPAAAGAEAGTSFEKAMERLEAIVHEMEGGSLGIEDMIARFEEGQRLIGFCARKLDEVERKVEMLVKKGDEVVAEPFEETEAAGEEPPEPKDAEELF